ncbi:glucosyltransferase domain-containing protein [Escherichia coli]|nr:hypothetical protein [Escherichia coli]EHK3813123.1 glucosyltransferase domain-containing protein [Escherichia coli]EKQ4391455.1 glucosyltransferase domain-containing protein [Escherichia coli]
MKNNIKIYLFITFLLALPIIIANVYYSDDMSRAMSGVTYWGIDGRPLSDRLMIILNFNNHLTDLAPLPLIIACLLLSISFYLFHIKLFNSDNHYLFLPLSFLLSPFIIEPLSYRFDSLTISASIFFAFAFICLNYKNTVISFILHSSFIVILFSFYQASINIVFILISIEMFVNIKNNKEPTHIIKSIAFRIIEVLVGAVIYMRVVLPLTHVNDNSQNHPGVATNIIDVIHKNFIAYYDFYTRNIIPEHGSELLIGSFIVSFAFAIKLVFVYIKKHKCNAAVFLSLMAVLSLPLTFISSMISLLLLENTLTTFARVYIGFNGLFLFIFTILYLGINNTRIINGIFLIFLFYIITLFYSYGNALRAQDDKNKYIAEIIGLALKNVPKNSVNVMFNGSSPKSPILLNSELNYPLFKTIVLDYFYNWYGSHVYLKIRGVNQNYPDFSSKEVSMFMKDYCKSTLIYSSNDIKIYRDNENVMVSFDDSLCK